MVIFKCNLDAAQSRNYGAPSEDRTYSSVVIDLATQACQPLHYVEVSIYFLSVDEMWHKAESLGALSED